MDVEKKIGYVNPNNLKKNHGFDIYTFRCLCKLLKIIFSKKICVTFVVLICLMALLEQYLVYNVGILPSGFYKVLGDKSWRGFWMQVLKACLLILAICSVMGCKKYITDVFYVSSRQIMTDKLHMSYFTKNKFYFLNTSYISTDNPDQRITQDIDKFCNQFSSVINPFVIAPFTISYYSYKCYEMTGWIGPLSAFIVFLLSVTINKVLMKPIILKVIQQEKFEGHFRFKHMHVRTHAESIAFQDANFAELSRADSKLFDLVKTQQGLYLREFPLNFAVNVFNYAGSIICYLLVAFPIFSGKYNNLTASELSQLISQNAFVSIYLISCFSSLISLSSTVSEIGGLTHRVYEMLEILSIDNGSDDDEETAYESKFKLKPRVYSGNFGTVVFDLQDVTICPPNETKPLVCNLNLQITFGSNILVTGKSSSGKTSIFRVIKGLWPVHSGQITRKLPFVPSVVFFLPQHSLLSDGTLLEQIVYPLELPKCVKLRREDTDSILWYMNYVELQHIVERAGLNSEVDWNWYDVLSPGEAQRLSFVRLFYHRPRIAFLDEATSALGLEMEKKVYIKCKELDITLVSIGHRESLFQYHDMYLHLDGEGGWNFSVLQTSNV